MEDVQSKLLKQLVIEMGELYGRLNELEKSKTELEEQVAQLRRAEEESHNIQASLEEQLAKRESEIQRLMNNLNNEREVFEKKWGSLRQQVHAWFNSIFENGHDS